MIDIIIIAIVGLCVLFGLYRGFIQSVLNLAGGIASVVASFWLFPKLADVLSANTAITRTISTYTDSGSLLGNLDLSSLPVLNLTQQNIAEIISRADLPAPMDTLLEHNLSSMVFAPLGDLATSVGDYVNQTILSVSINVLCFLLCFAACYIVVHILINLLRAVFRFPVLKHLDWLMGGAFGFLQGILLCFAVLTVLPLMESIIPIPEFRQLVDESQLAQVFTNGNLIISIMNRKL